MTFQRNSTIKLYLSMTILVVTACCSRSGDHSLTPLGPFTPAECSECRVRAVSGVPSNVVCLERSWESNGERLWVRYYIRDKDLLLVSRKFSSFSLITNNSPLDPVVAVTTIIASSLEAKVKTRGLIQWMGKCVSSYLQGIAVDDIFTENEMSFRFFTYKERIIFDYAKTDTMKNLTPSRED